MSSLLAFRLLLISNRSNMYNMNEYASSPSFIERPNSTCGGDSGLFPSNKLVPSAMALALVAPSDNIKCVGGGLVDVVEREHHR